MYAFKVPSSTHCSLVMNPACPFSPSPNRLPSAPWVSTKLSISFMLIRTFKPKSASVFSTSAGSIPAISDTVFGGSVKPAASS